MNKVFTRSPIQYKIVGWTGLGVGGWVLCQNCLLSAQGFAMEGWDGGSIWPMTAAIAVIESCISIFLTHPSTFDEIWESINEMALIKTAKAPKAVTYTFISLTLALLASICVGSYAFDFWSTHMGLYPNSDYTAKSSLFTLGYNFGTEILAYLSYQVLCLGARVEAEKIKREISTRHEELVNRYVRAELENSAREEGMKRARQIRSGGWDQGRVNL